MTSIWCSYRLLPSHIWMKRDFVNRQRANIGAVLNRLDATATNLQINAENTSAARSRIMDADFAQGCRIDPAAKS